MYNRLHRQESKEANSIGEIKMVEGSRLLREARVVDLFPAVATGGGGGGGGGDGGAGGREGGRGGGVGGGGEKTP